MAAPDANGVFPSEEDEYDFVLDNALLWDAVFNEFGYDVVLEYGSYRQVDARKRRQILTWCRRQDFYWDEVLGLDEEEDTDEEEEDQEEVVDDQNEVVQQQNVVEPQPNVVEHQNNVVEEQQQVVEEQRTVVEEQPNLVGLENRITALEIVFGQLKEIKEHKERMARDASMAESSGSNRLG